jgi:hypothetical protein
MVVMEVVFPSATRLENHADVVVENALTVSRSSVFFSSTMIIAEKINSGFPVEFVIKRGIHNGEATTDKGNENEQRFTATRIQTR